MRRRLTLIISALLLGAALAIFSHGRVVNDLDLFLPAGATANQRLALTELRRGPAARLLMIAVDGQEPTALAETSRRLAARLRRAPNFTLVANGEPHLAPALRHRLFGYRYLLTEGDFSETALHEALSARLRELASAAAPLLSADLAADPTATFRHLLQGWRGAGAAPRRHGVWLGADGTRALLIAYTAAPGYDLGAQAQNVAAVHGAFAAVRGPHQRLRISGPPTFALAARAAIRNEVLWLSLAGSLGVILLLWAAFRSPRVVVAAAVPLACAVAAGGAAVVLGFGTVNGITIAFAVTLLGVAVDYPIHLFGHGRGGEHADAALARIWPTLRLGIATTALGYLAMLFAPYAGLAQLGAFACAGLLAAAAATRWLLPALLPRLPEPRLPTPRLGRLAARVRRLAPLPLLAALLAVALLTTERGHLWEQDPAALSPVPAGALRFDHRLRAELRAPDLRHLLLIRGRSAETVLQRCEALTPRLAALVTRGAAQGFDSPCRYLPSVATQRRRQRAIPPPAELKARLHAALGGLPFRPGYFAPFLSAAATARTLAPLTPRTLFATSLGVRLQSLLFRQDDGWVGVVLPHHLRAPAVLARLAREMPGVSTLDLHATTRALMAGYRDSVLGRALVGLGAMVLLLGVALRSPRAVVRVFAPVLSAVLLTAAVLVTSGHPLTLFHLVALLLVVGLGIDYALFFNRPDGGTPRTLTALALCAASTILVFGLLGLAQTPVLRAIGQSVALGALLSLLFAAAMARDDIDTGPGAQS